MKASRNVRLSTLAKLTVGGVFLGVAYLVLDKVRGYFGDPRPLWAMPFYSRDEWVIREHESARAIPTGAETYAAPANPVHGYILTDYDKSQGVDKWSPPSGLRWAPIRVEGEGESKMLVSTETPMPAFPARIQAAIDSGVIKFL